MNSHMNNFFSLSFDELSLLLKTNAHNEITSSKLYRWYYKQLQNNFFDLECAQKTLKFIKDELSFELPTIKTIETAEDGTVKFLFELKDKNTIETVLIPFAQKYSVCLSSQVGCAMKCSFCYTGTMGLKRNLTTDEIIGQFLGVSRWLKENRPHDIINLKSIKSIVFMGQGEPLHNFENVNRSIKIFKDQHGFSLGKERITISTSGFIPGIEQWLKSDLDVNIALSFHSPFNEIRNKLIPINEKYPIQSVLKLISQIPMNKKQYITIEYLLIQNLTDRDEDINEMVKLFANQKIVLNLIPFNPYPGSLYQRPTDARILNFKQQLDANKVPTTLRSTKGDEILAACGQLKSKNLN